MRTLIITIIIIAILAFLFAQSKSIYQKITFSFRFIGTAFTSQNLIELLAKGRTDTQVTLGATVKNENNLPFTISNLSAQLFYNKTLVAETVQGSNALAKIIVPANNSVEVIDNVNILINESAIQLIHAIATGKKPSVDYIIKATILGIPFKFSESFTWK